MKNPSKTCLWMLSLHLLFLTTIFQVHAQSIPDEWLILGPIPVAQLPDEEMSEEAQIAAFNNNYLDPASLSKVKSGQKASIADTDYSWTAMKVENQIISLDKLYDTVDYASAYGWVEFKSAESKKVLLGVGSDDGVKVWVNGELVHDNWIPRGIQPDNDLVPVTLKKGKNQILLKVQDIMGGWGFSCRILPPDSYAEKLTEAVARGQAESLDMLLERGADINAKNAFGLTALQTAEMRGKKDIAEKLKKMGADDAVAMPAAGEMADAFFASVVSENQPGASVLVARDGKIIYKKGFGLADLEKGLPVTPETEFRIGSITKQFTAAAILKLYEEGKLSLEDKLSHFIADYPKGDEVTIHHLLTHTSGIKSYTDKIRFDTEEVTLPVAGVEEHIESFKNDPYNFEPGESWSYNNSGYFLLGYIIEKVGGMPYGEYLERNFFQPLGMEHTGVHYGGIKLEREARGYSYENGQVKIAPDWEMSWAGGAGALYSTLDDLFKWNEAVFNGKVLQDATLKAAFTPAKLNNGKAAQPGYGYGWMFGEYRGWRDISHGGGLPGFITFLTRFPEQNVTVAILTNASPPDKLNPQQAAYDLAEIFFWEEMAALPSLVEDESADKSMYNSYVGRYDYRGGAVLMVTNEDNRLFAQLTGQPKFEIFPQGNGKFFWKVVDAQVEFVSNDAGEVVHAIHTQGGQSFEAPRLKEEEVVIVDSAILDMLVGTYDLNGRDLTVMKENENLFVQLTGQPKFQMFAKSDLRFFLKEVNADLTFVKDEGGQIAKVVLEQGGNKFDLPRKK